jgi:Zn-dependent protease with chaperone function
MFAVRAIAVSLSTFFVVYCASSLAVSLWWKALRRWDRQLSMRRRADLLFALRLLPLVAATIVTAVFTIPSFLLLEPRGIDEPMSVFLLLLGLAGAAVGIYGLANASIAIVRARQTIASWSDRAELASSNNNIPVLRISPAVPAMATAGIIHSKIMVSSVAESLLAAGELQTALNHELAHVRRRDNLKKLLLRFATFPGMTALDEAWLEATEMAADDAAVSSRSDALDLASALIKLSRLGPADPSADLTMALIHRPASVMNARVERLISWNDARPDENSISLRYGLAVAIGMSAILAVTYTQLLVHVHTATEWLVR